MSGPDRDLVQVGYHVADGIQPVHAALLMRVDLDAADLRVPRSQRGCEFGANVASQHRINHVKTLARAIAQHRDDVAALPLERNGMRCLDLT